MMKKLRLAVAGFSHETITFWPGLTTLEDFERDAAYGLRVLEKARGTNTCIGGFMEVCEAEGVELVPVLNASGGATATVADEGYDRYVPLMRKGVREVTAVFGFQSSPHVDMRNTGARAARAMVRTLRGEIKPTAALRKSGIVVPSVFSATTGSPARDIIDRIRAWEREPGVVNVTAIFGFARDDVG